MKRLFIMSALLLNPIIASAACFKIDVSKLNRSNVNSYFEEVLGSVDYSQCRADELKVAKESLLSFGATQATQMQSTDWATKSSSAMYVALAKSSLALIQIELEKRK